MTSDTNVFVQPLSGYRQQSLHAFLCFCQLQSLDLKKKIQPSDLRVATWCPEAKPVRPELHLTLFLKAAWPRGAEHVAKLTPLWPQGDEHIAKLTPLFKT